MLQTPALCKRRFCYSSEPGLRPRSLAPETWHDWFVDSTGVVSQVLGEALNSFGFQPGLAVFALNVASRPRQRLLLATAPPGIEEN
jgi:hypothetical protein